MKNCYLPVVFYLAVTTHILERDALGISVLLKRETAQSLALAHPDKIPHLCIYIGLGSLHLAAWRA